MSLDHWDESRLQSAMWGQCGFCKRVLPFADHVKHAAAQQVYNVSGQASCLLCLSASKIESNNYCTDCQSFQEPPC